MLQQNLHPQDDFIGHVGGDDFIALCRSKDWRQRIIKLLQDFDQQVVGYYSAADQAAGGIYAEDRFGTQRFFPFVAISVAAVQPEGGSQTTAHALSADVAHLKHFAKQVAGSSLVLGQDKSQQLLWSAKEHN